MLVIGSAPSGFLPYFLPSLNTTPSAERILRSRNRVSRRYTSSISRKGSDASDPTACRSTRHRRSHSASAYLGKLSTTGSSEREIRDSSVAGSDRGPAEVPCNRFSRPGLAHVIPAFRLGKRPDP